MKPGMESNMSSPVVIGIDIGKEVFHKLIRGLYDDWCCLDERIEAVTGEIELLSRSEAKCRQLMSVPGIGPPR